MCIRLSNFGMEKARYFKFCMQIDHDKNYRKDDKLPPLWAVTIYFWDPLLKFRLSEVLSIPGSRDLESRDILDCFTKSRDYDRVIPRISGSKMAQKLLIFCVRSPEIE